MGVHILGGKGVNLGILVLSWGHHDTGERGGNLYAWPTILDNARRKEGNLTVGFLGNIQRNNTIRII